jgi:hypothetical protein
MRKFTWMWMSMMAAGLFLTLPALRAQERHLQPLEDRTGVDPDGYTLELPPPETGQVGIAERDGKWVMTVRVASQGAAGLQLFIDDLRLGEGATAALYEAGLNGERGAQIASYTATGPLQGDGFWTAAVAGSEAVLEVTMEAGQAGALPLRIRSLRHLSAEGLAKLTAAQESEFPGNTEGGRGYTDFRGVVVPFEVKNGLAVFEGDIILGPANEIRTVSSKEKAGQRQSQGITGSYYRWTGGIVPYTIDPTLPNQYRITDAIAHWNNQLAGTIKLQPRNGEGNYVHFANTTSSGTCSSYIGNVRIGAQPVTVGSNCSTGNVIHEIGHAIGLYHEHTREDRNTFVKINFANIDSTKTHNFDQAISTSDDLGAYDYGSIMHYPAYAFSINGQPTIETIPAGISIGQRSTLSSGDIAGVKMMYPSTSATSSVSVTVGSNPSGMQLVVDGATVTAPATFNWTAGSAHTISAPNVNAGSTRFTYKNWSDGGAQTHTVTAPTSTWTVTANYQKQYTFSSASSNTSLGAVSHSPSSTDSFYNEGTSMTVTAVAVGSACFTGWSGVTAPSSSPISVTLNQPQQVTGNFQTGAVSVSPSVFNGFSASGGTASVSVSSSGGCAWTAKSNVSWITITSGASGTSSGTVGFSVARRPNKKSRTGTISIGSATVTVKR